MRYTLLFMLFALPAFAEAPIHDPAKDPNTLVIKHSENEVANDPLVVAAKKKATAATADTMNAAQQRQQLNQQVEAASQKYLQESRTPQAYAPGQYQPFIQSHQQRADALNTQLRSTGGNQALARQSAKTAAENLRLALLTARIDNPAYQIFVTEGTTWEERTPGGALEQRITLRDITGTHYSLQTPQAVTISTVSCTYQPVWGEIWALRGAALVPVDPKALKNALVQIKIAALPQLYLLEHVAKSTCPFGHVLIPRPKDE